MSEIMTVVDIIRAATQPEPMRLQLLEKHPEIQRWAIGELRKLGPSDPGSEAMQTWVDSVLLRRVRDE